MPFYTQLGKIPHKRHTTFRKEDGSLHHEQLFGTIGFAGMSSLLYHLHRPTMVKAVGEPVDVRPVAAVERNMMSRKLEGFKVAPHPDVIAGRVPVLFNNDCTIALAAPTASMPEDQFYKNADCDEVVFVHEGSGTLRTMFGQVKFVSGDYLVIPRGVIHNWVFDGTDNRLFITESAHPVYTPKRYRNYFGQLLEHSPY